MSEIDYDILSKIVCNTVENVVQSILKSNLENSTCQQPSFSFQQEKGEDTMPSRFREKIKVGVDEFGNPIYEWVAASTKEELHTEIFKALSKHNSVQENSHTKNTVLWEELSDEWFNVFHTKKLRKKTLSKDTSLYKNHVRPAFIGMPVNSVTSTTVQSFLESKSSYCKSQVRDIMSMLKQVFSLAVDKDIIFKNPMDSKLVFNPSTKADKPRNALSTEDQIDIIANLDKLRNVYDKHGDNMNALRFMAFIMFTGLRPCEIYGLRWEDLNIERCTLTVNRDLVFDCGAGILGKPKTETSKREIPFDPQVLDYIKPFHKSGFIIHMTEKGRESEHFTEQAATNMWARIKRSIDVHGMTPYMGRHTFATNMNKAGVPIRTAMAMMGHKDERMLLRRYTHVDTEDLTKASESVSSYMAANILGQS